MKAMKYEGGCLCQATTYIVQGEPINPHLCFCTMCQKSSGAPTVAWVEFPLAPIPGKHSCHESAPIWWEVEIKNNE